jgi:creatinine amidohydrolase
MIAGHRHSEFDLAAMTTTRFAALRELPGKLVVLLPVGSVEPHGPHLSLLTDTVISEVVAVRAAQFLNEQKAPPIHTLIAPSIPYGVTDCAAGFAGGISIPGNVLTAYVAAVAQSLRAAGADLVCIINNHLEPAQDAAIRAAAGPGIVVACPLTRKWARTLSAEFKSGACHAGQYETSIVLAADAGLVDADAQSELADVPISLSAGLQAGLATFIEMGMSQAYAGSPSRGSVAEGNEMIDRLADMVVSEVIDGLGHRMV